jgi:transcriptional regulator with XRE-family HTH domain
MAELTGWDRTKISKLENGRQMPTADEIRIWAEVTGNPGAEDELQEVLAQALGVHRQYRHLARRGQAAIQQDFDQMVRSATRIRNFEISVIPGLLQTPQYAYYRMLDAVNYGFDPERIDETVRERMARTRVLDEPGRTFEFIITEVPWRGLLGCPPDVMLDQVNRLHGVLGSQHIALAIIPADRYVPYMPMHGFLLLDGEVHLETHSALDPLPPRESADYENVADQLLAEAVTGDDARHLLIRAGDHLRSLISNE